MNKIIASLFITFALLLTGCVHQQTESQSTATIIQSPNDDRQYEYLVLPNQLRVVLVSDKEADKGAASLTVGVGSAANPTGREGLAHFLEHMLFMGTSKYPGVDEYGAFIKQHGGSTNAFTADNETTYLFDIKQEELEPALDRFSQFFVAPLFATEYVEREKKAVHSEYQLSLKEESWRTRAAEQQIMNPDSPYARFSVGSLETLADRDSSKVRDDLLAFYKLHYSANLMTLVVIGREPLPILKQWVEEKFSAVPNQQSTRFVPATTQYLESQLPMYLQVLPLKEVRSVDYSFPIPSIIKHYQTKPARFLSHFIGDEGKGSLLSLLKQKGWATALSAGADKLDSTESLFSVSIDLTSEGISHVDEITSYLFEYIHLLTAQGVADWRYAEQAKQADLAFRFKEKGASLWYAVSVSGAMQYYPAQDVLRASSMKAKYDAKLIQGYLDYISPENMIMTVISPDVQTSELESDFQVRYQANKIPQAQVVAWANPASNPNLALPQRNQFLPDEVALKPVDKPSPMPVKVQNMQKISLWHQQETVFGVPRGSFIFMLKSDMANDSPRHGVLRELLVETINEQLNEFAYPASIAGLAYDINGNSKGLQVSINGYDQKQGVLLERIVATMKQPDFDAGKFQIYKEELRRTLENMALDKPFRQLLGERTRVMTAPSWSPAERLAVMDDVSLDELKSYAASFFDSLEVEALSYGNVTADEASALGAILEQQLLSDTSMSEVKERQVRTLSSGTPLTRDYYVDHPDSVLIYQFQGNDKSVQEEAKWRLLGQIMNAPFFNSLRTEQQLGYAVISSYIDDEQVPALVMLVQSSVVSASEVQNRMRKFIQDFSRHIEEMDEQAFASHQQGLVSDLMKKDESYLSRAYRYWGDMDRENYTFDHRQKISDQVMALQKSQLLYFYQQQVQKQPRLLVVSDTGNKFGE